VSQGHLAPTGSPAREEGGPPNKPTNRNSSEGPIIVHSREARNSSHSAGTECSRETPAAPGAQPAPATPDEVAEKLTKQRRSATPINQKISDELKCFLGLALLNRGQREDCAQVCETDEEEQKRKSRAAG